MKHDPFDNVEPDDPVLPEDWDINDPCAGCDEFFDPSDLHRCCMCGGHICIDCHGFNCSSVEVFGAVDNEGWPLVHCCICNRDACLGQLMMLRLRGGAVQ